MNKEDLELLGFTIEVLPSGYINLINQQPFHYNGTTTICRHSRAGYIRTTTHKTLDGILNNLTELRMVENDSHSIKRASVKTEAPIKKKTKAVKSVQEDPLEALTDQDLGAFLTSQSEATDKPRRTRKTTRA